ncbi:hypothetical protein P9D43_20390 [Neobacillus niacini]|uniref:hypothetical protein n=1 Tax=Neobacillus niacini TaxID=86668 RepID=UPI000AE144D3|nr:hypothetical protein [Neobacillus niacini]MEC1524363.1 hypothetical protein [Neobacillus niacini]
MTKKKENQLTIKRVFAGSEKIENLLLPFINHEIDEFIQNLYDESMASATPEGVANK